MRQALPNFKRSANQIFGFLLHFIRQLYSNCGGRTNQRYKQVKDPAHDNEASKEIPSN
jgi:hypothetical protein